MLCDGLSSLGQKEGCRVGSGGRIRGVGVVGGLGVWAHSVDPSLACAYPSKTDVRVSFLF